MAKSSGRLLLAHRTHLGQERSRRTSLDCLQPHVSRQPTPMATRKWPSKGLTDGECGFYLVGFLPHGFNYIVSLKTMLRASKTIGEPLGTCQYLSIIEESMLTGFWWPGYFVRGFACPPSHGGSLDTPRQKKTDGAVFRFASSSVCTSNNNPTSTLCFLTTRPTMSFPVHS